MLLCGTAIRGRKLHQLILQGDQPEGWSFWGGEVSGFCRKRVKNVVYPQIVVVCRKFRFID